MAASYLCGKHPQLRLDDTKVRSEEITILLDNSIVANVAAESENIIYINKSFCTQQQGKAIRYLTSVIENCLHEHNSVRTLKKLMESEHESFLR